MFRVRIWLGVAALAIMSAATARSQPLNLYAAVQEGVDVETLTPQIVERYGEISRERNLGRNMLPLEDEESPLVSLLIEQDEGLPAFFMFCEGALMSFDVPTNMEEAYVLARSAGSSGSYDLLSAELAEDWIRMETQDQQLIIGLRPRDDHDLAAIRATYPIDAYMFMDFYDRCVPR